jgi:hypothetical protein
MSLSLIEKTNEVLRAWETLAPQATFAGMTAQEFRETLQPLVAIRQRIALLDQQRQGSMAARDMAEKEMAITLQLIVDSIKGTPAYGKDSELYAAIGYVTRSARQSGLTRKKAQSETALAQ